ncbi:MAG: HIT family protein [Propionibacterium sp.]|nr:HIT family protein [Propionibacterium sp.]
MAERRGAPSDPADPAVATDTDVVCAIVAGHLDAEIVHRDDGFIAFLDHRPVFPGHVLVCPVAHIANLNELDTAVMGPLLALARRISLAQQTALGADGSFVALNNIVSQSVPHVHLHVVPRRRHDGLHGFLWPRQRYADGQDTEVAAALRAALTEV